VDVRLFVLFYAEFQTHSSSQRRRTAVEYKMPFSIASVCGDQVDASFRAGTLQHLLTALASVFESWGFPVHERAVVLWHDQRQEDQIYPSDNNSLFSPIA
jgi:hypothetical protein